LNVSLILLVLHYAYAYAYDATQGRSFFLDSTTGVRWLFVITFGYARKCLRTAQRKMQSSGNKKRRNIIRLSENTNLQ